MSEVKDTQVQPKIEIAVKNFGPIAEANIDLRPLTVFVGPSNTGKTYFATLVYAMHRCLNGYARIPLLYDTPFHATNILMEDETSPESNKHFDISNLSIILETDDQPHKLTDMPVNLQDNLRKGLKNVDIYRNEFRRCYDIDSEAKLLRLVGTEIKDMNISIIREEEQKKMWSVEIQNTGNGISVDEWINEDINLHNKEGDILIKKVDLNDSANFYIISRGKDQNRQCYFLPDARSGIMQSLRVIATSLVKRSTRVGLERFPEVPTMTGVIADFMERIILYEDDKVSKNVMQHIAETLENEVLCGQIRVQLTGSGYPDFRYLPYDSNEEFRLSQSSSMVSELAPFVLYLRGIVHQDDTLIIEEPEAHLHPGAQADMAVILARLVRAGVRVIITTHSDWLLQEIGNLIRAGELEKAGEEDSELPTSLQPEEVGIWHFQKNGMVEEIPYNRIDGIEPLEYLDVAEDLYNRSARLQIRLEELKGEKKRESE